MEARVGGSGGMIVAKDNHNPINLGIINEKEVSGGSGDMTGKGDKNGSGYVDKVAVFKNQAAGQNSISEKEGKFISEHGLIISDP